MRALIVNDDGIDSVGLALLARVAVAAGLEVTVAAPHEERSGASASLSALHDDGRLLVHDHPLDGLPGVRALGVEASPAMIALVAARGAFGEPPDVVLSGINHGPNTGHAILHSGTVGAALTSALNGAAAAAFSLASARAENWPTAETVARIGVAWIVANGKPGWVLNINIPDIALDALRGLRPATLAAFGAVQADIGEVDQESVTVTFSEPTHELEDGTDAALLIDGWATASVLRAPFRDPDIGLDGLAYDPRRLTPEPAHRPRPAPDGRRADQ